MLTIIAGNWRGRKLRVPRGDKVRPSSAKVRGALFHIVESLQLKRGGTNDFSGQTCLDLCAGSGALGFEALSRGAERAVFVEKSREHARIIAENARELGTLDRVEILCQPVEAGVRTVVKFGPFDLVLADPPYDYPGLDALVRAVAAPDLLAPEGVFILEHGPKTIVAVPDGLALHSRRELGPAAISVFTRRTKEDMLNS